jgi:Domain of unknown function (DUF3850)
MKRATKPPTAGDTMQTHDLKTAPNYFDAVACGEKPFEVRRDDRGFQKGDRLLLRRYEIAGRGYTGEQITAKVTYVLTGGQLGIESGFVVMGLSNIHLEK